MAEMTLASNHFGSGDSTWLIQALSVRRVGQVSGGGEGGVDKICKEGALCRYEMMEAVRATGSTVTGSRIPKPPNRMEIWHWAHSVSVRGCPSIAATVSLKAADASPKVWGKASQAVERKRCWRRQASRQ